MCYRPYMGETTLPSSFEFLGVNEIRGMGMGIVYMDGRVADDEGVDESA